MTSSENNLPQQPSVNFWKRKLAAYLHDPPEKAYDFGPGHIKRAEVHAANFGIGELWKHLSSNPDWSAAAADRFIFPHGSKVGALGEVNNVAFVHPISGRADPSAAPTLPAGSLKFPSKADAEQWISDIQPEWKNDDPQTLFLRIWRLWSDHAASHPTGNGRGAELIPYLPADTRIPDGSIWHHCAIVSALEACRASDDLKSPLRPAFLLFQVGPVQEFIAQARSTRDSWSGSYLLSWLMMHAIKAVADRCGPDAVIFPSLKGQPLYDWLEKEKLGLQPDQAAVLVPGIPNRFLAIVPDSFDATTVTAAFQAEWNKIAETCCQWLAERNLPISENLWNEQVDHFWQITWQLWPWQGVNQALKDFKAIPLGQDNALHLAKEIAEKIPDDHKDERCYRNKQLDPGWAWSAHYQLCQHALDARRALRDFRPFAYDPTRKCGHRDSLSGREEAVVQADQIKTAAAQADPNKAMDIHTLFRHAEPLGAANLIKRVWHKAYLGEVRGLHRARESFDSVPAVAAGTWLARLHQRLSENAELWSDLISLSQTLAEAKPHLHGIAIPKAIVDNQNANESKWIDGIDGEIFTARFWSALDTATASQDVVKKAAKAVADFKSTHKLGEPSPYYAVLALDGDQIGKWLSGEKSPAVQQVITAKAAEYFRQHLPNELVERWLASPRPISPSWHLQFSEALANFSLYAVPRIVEDVHHGQLIYAGGDDVLAMLPADEAIACAADLRAAFQGCREAMSEECKKLFKAGLPEGFLQLASPSSKQPNWPLLVPGPRMTVSVGIAIGHVKEPLQDMIAEAQKAEKRAKGAPEKFIFDRSDADPAKHGEPWKPASGWDRDALAVTLFKRSGETIEWGAKFGSAALELLAYLRRHYRPAWDQPDQETAITGRFPYRLAELLNVYGADSPVTQGIHEIALKEFEHVISRQTITDENAAKSGSDFRRESLRDLGERYLTELRDFQWKRQPGDTHETKAPRTLRQFINLFLLEAFIRRQAD
jgi:CRISPR-associated protein Cmr2